MQKYAPFIYRYARSSGLTPDDAADVTQNVLLQLTKSLRNFDRKSTGSFRRWLKIVTVNKVNDYLRRQGRRNDLDAVYAGKSKAQPGVLTDIANQEQSDSSSERQSERSIEIQFVLEQVKAEVNETTWQAFHLMVARGRTSVEVGEELGISPDSVRMAKKRVLDKIQTYWKMAGEERK